MTTVDQLAALRTPAGEAALTAAATLVGDDPLTAATALRAQGVAPDLAAAALTQATLRTRAVAKFGPDAHRMFLTRPGLEQATRAVVAARRAARLAAAGVRHLADLGCGIGADTIACAQAGLQVTAVEADPATAAVAAANLAALGLTDRATVHAGRAEQADLSDVDAVFCDPARRTRTGRRLFDPDTFSPSWDFLLTLPHRVPRTVLKLAPGLDHARIPTGAEAAWVSVDGDLVEATLWHGPLAEVPRRATVLRDGQVTELTGSGRVAAPTGPVRGYLYDPDPAVIRAGLVAEFAATMSGHLADPTIAYVYADTAVATPLARCLAVEQVLPFSLKRLRATLRTAGIGHVEIMKRGSAVDVEHLRRQLRLSGTGAATLVLTRVAGSPTVLVCQRLP
ncbi:MAG TPA: methyltransferase domain-containing protein [Natronosporangium sp.]|nr:methyltransferase domain-containing protein [Natronosporangium sp.]